jgi:hypothetical protein
MFRLTEVSEQALVLIHFLAGRGLRLIRARSIHNGSNSFWRTIGWVSGKKTNSRAFPGLCRKSWKYHWFGLFFWLFLVLWPITHYILLKNNLLLKRLCLDEILIQRGFQTHCRIVMRLLHTLGKDTHNTVLLNPLENNKSPVRLGGRSMTTWTKRSG